MQNAMKPIVKAMRQRAPAPLVDFSGVAVCFKHARSSGKGTASTIERPMETIERLKNAAEISWPAPRVERTVAIPTRVVIQTVNQTRHCSALAQHKQISSANTKPRFLHT